MSEGCTGEGWTFLAWSLPLQPPRGLTWGTCFLLVWCRNTGNWVIFLLVGSALDENHVTFFMSKRMQALLSPEPLAIFLCGYSIITTVLRDHILTSGIKVSAHSRYRKWADASNKTTLVLPLLSLVKLSPQMCFLT